MHLPLGYPFWPISAGMGARRGCQNGVPNGRGAGGVKWELHPADGFTPPSSKGKMKARVRGLGFRPQNLLPPEPTFLARFGAPFVP